MLLGEGDLLIGKPGRSLTIGLEDAACIIERLPAGKTATTLPEGFGDGEVVHTDCTTSPVDLPVDKNGHWENVLLGQTVTLALNLRLNPELCDFALCPEIKTQAMLPGPDGMIGTPDDVIDPDDPGQVFSHPQEVLDVLKSDDHFS